MPDFAEQSALVRLLQRPLAYRWLWARHAAVHELSQRSGGRHRIWITLAGLAARDGVMIKRDALRQTWPKVHEDWENASINLRMANVDPANSPTEAEDRSPRLLQKASAKRELDFSKSSAAVFSLPDMTGRKT